jgi:hypothetical protein
MFDLQESFLVPRQGIKAAAVFKRYDGACKANVKEKKALAALRDIPLR